MEGGSEAFSVIVAVSLFPRDPARIRKDVRHDVRDPPSTPVSRVRHGGIDMRMGIEKCSNSTLDSKAETRQEGTATEKESVDQSRRSVMDYCPSKIIG